LKGKRNSAIEWERKSKRGGSIGLGGFLFGFYLVVLPLVSSLQVKIYDRVGIDNIWLLGVGCLACLVLFTRPSHRGSLVGSRALRNFVFAYFIVVVMAIMMTLWRGGSSREIMHALRLSQPMLIYLCVVTYAVNERASLFLLKCFLSGAAIACTVGIAQMAGVEVVWRLVDKYYLANLDKLTTSYMYKNRMAAVSLFPPNGNMFGSYMGVGILVCMAAQSLQYKRLWGLLALFFGIGLLSSISLTAIASTIFAIVFAAWSMRRLLSLRVKRSSIRWLGAILMGVALGMWLYGEKVVDKVTRYVFLPSKFGLIRGLDDRIAAWRGSSAFFADRSILETFFGSGYRYAFSPDNFYLELFQISGITGLLAYCGTALTLLFFLLRMTRWGLSRERGFRVALSSVLYLLLLNLTASYGGYMPVIIGVILILRTATYRWSKVKAGV